MKKLNILILFFTLLASGSFAQQDLMISQYMTNLLPTNPAYAGTSGNFNAMAISRHQWVGFEGAPTSNILVINSPFLKHNIGVGFTLIHDQVGPIQQTLVYADFAYNINLTARTKLSFGLKAGMNLQQPDLSSIETLEADPSFLVPQEAQIMPNFGFGMYLYSVKYYVGVSTPKLLTNSFTPGGDTEVSMEGGEERHYFIIGGGVITLSDNWKLRPSTFVKLVPNAPPSVDVSAMAIVKDAFWFGSTYRIGDGFAFITQYQLNRNFRLGYSYDIALTKMSSTNAGTHEVMLSYDMNFRPNKIVTTRYF